jgi:CheY-like chemotaxis protein
MLYNQTLESYMTAQPKRSEIVSDATPTVLSVSPEADDHTKLSAILDQSEAIFSSGVRWQLRACPTLEKAMASLQAGIPIVVTACDLAPGCWRELYEKISLLPDPPIMIVASRLADDRLWAEALNVGAYDVLSKPFEAREVIHVLGSAWRHWTDLHEHVHAGRPQTMVAKAAE